MDLKSCSRCGLIHARGEKCPVKNWGQKTDTDKLRNRRRWKKKSRQIREDSLNLCAVCLDQGTYTYNDLEVHHIKKLRDNPDGLLEDDNLICLCRDHHKQADAGEIKEEYLIELVEKRKRGEL